MQTDITGQFLEIETHTIPVLWMQVYNILLLNSLRLAFTCKTSASCHKSKKIGNPFGYSIKTASHFNA
ncbi:MAG: hypothetical protein HY965_08550 [Ignavibacteriales bacterium]|nr:hypothetical protein [Ignavibacteriales bacterium]